ncbi:MAG: hypothetical protein JNL79_07795 [Myxococcales bacterium]|nr:hypothetical protein [Myxococcales bacterium]
MRFASLLVLAPLAGACGGERPAPLVVDDAGADVEPMEVCVFDTDLPDVPPSLWIAPRAPLVLVDPGRSTPLTATLTFAVDPATLPVTFTLDDPSLGTFADSTFHVSTTGFTGERWTSVRATGGGLSDEVRLLVLAIPGAEDPDPLSHALVFDGTVGCGFAKPLGDVLVFVAPADGDHTLEVTGDPPKSPLAKAHPLAADPSGWCPVVSVVDTDKDFVPDRFVGLTKGQRVCARIEPRDGALAESVTPLTVTLRSTSGASASRTIVHVARKPSCGVRP